MFLNIETKLNWSEYKNRTMKYENQVFSLSQKFLSIFYFKSNKASKNIS